jgi:outer membrane protein with beta-barrel domain
MRWPLTHRWSSLRVGVLLIGTVAHSVAAQDLRVAVFGAAGVANVYRTEDQSFGTTLNVGVGLGIERKQIGLDAEVHRTIGLTPRAVRCAISNVPCVGSAREGFLDATMLSGNVSYVFSGPRVRPFVTGSIGVLWTESVNSLTIVSGAVATVSEFHEQDTGLAIGAGFGVDVPLTPALSLRPEFRSYSSVAMSRVNLGLHRGLVGVRYRW